MRGLATMRPRGDMGAMMMMLFAPVAAALLSVPAPHVGHAKHRHALYARMHPQRGGIRDEAALQRRVVRETRLALLVRREALLHDFLMNARTESPVFHDDTTYRLDRGIQIDSTRVSLDFIGSAIIRARITNLAATRRAVLLEADVASAQGARGRAAEALTLQPGETRTVELLCPENISPASLIWSTTPL